MTNTEELEKLKRVLAELGNVENWTNLLQESQNGLAQSGKSAFEPTVQEIAIIGFDTNILLALKRDGNTNTRVNLFLEKNKDAIHAIVPAQSLLEFWNNSEKAVNELSTEQLKKKTEPILEVLNKNEQVMSQDLVDSLRDDLARLEEFNDLYKPQKATTDITLFIKTLTKVAYISQVPRQEFLPIFEQRQKTGIAPGFRDSLKATNVAGDFFVWADFLYGCLHFGEDGNTASEAKYILFITNEKKVDWLPNDFVHPVLVSEVASLAGKKLIVMDLKQFKKLVNRLIK